MPNVITFVRMSRLAVVIASLSLAGALYAEEPKAISPAATAPSEPVAAPAASQPANPEQVAAFRQRVEQYWSARQSRDITTVYGLESAAQPGGWLKLENAMMLMGLPVRKAKVEEIQIEGERAKTKISAEVNIGTFGWTPQAVEDPWVLVNGQWFHETTPQ